jgi:hypothetical protein
MAKLGTIGKKLDLLIKQGSTFGEYPITLKNVDKTPKDLTGYIFNGKIKKSYTSPTVLANIQFREIDLVNGIIGMYISAEITQTLKGNPNGISEYVYDIEYTDTNNFVEPILYGDVEVFSNA